MGQNTEILLDIIKHERIYFDGAMGTVLLQKGGAVTSELITEIHSEYLNAGANIITTNTFNISKNKFSDYEERIHSAIKSAKKATSGKANAFTAFDMCPLGKLIEPLGPVTFDEAVSIFESNACLAEKYGADLIIIETMTDLKEACAALTAAKTTSLPVFATCAFSENGRLLTGATPYDVVKSLEELGVDALGVNCSYGPDKMMPVIKELIKYSSVPVIVNPNAGLPEIVGGKSVYNIDADAFSDYMVSIAKMGACILGGCCGTTPEYIRQTVSKTKDIPYVYPSKKDIDNMVDSMKEEAEEKAKFNKVQDKVQGKDVLSHPLCVAILEGENEVAEAETKKLIKTISPLEIINGYIIPALSKVGDDFGKGDLFLSELMMSAETASEAFKVVKANMSMDDENSKGSIIIATVKGDVHDIGKDIAKVLLESYGYKIYDLGIDVSPQKVLDEVKRTGCKLVGLSALMTTTIPAMQQTIELLHKSDLGVRVIAGSAVLNPQSAAEIGADYFAPDAMATVNHTMEFYK